MARWWIYAYVMFATSILVSAGGDLCNADPTTQNKKVYAQDPAIGQLPQYAATHKNITCILTADGRPEDSETAVLQVGYFGPILLQDTILLSNLAHLNRERIPPRVVHAKGAGAFGYFIVTKDITRYCKASVFAKVGQKTSIRVRFSVAGPSSRGQVDSLREIRGFAIKFCTDQGTWDLVGNNVPVFFINSPIKFVTLTHSQGRNPATNVKDPNSFWDFATRNNETILTELYRFSYFGLPRNFRTMNGHGINTFKLVNAQGVVVYCKFHYLTNQKVQSLTPAETDRLAATDPDALARDLYDSIDRKDYPSWTFYIQVMTVYQEKKVNFNPFDPTRQWPQEQFPYIEVGKIVLNRNPVNFFSEVETLAFCPSHLPPGIEASQDPILQARLFAYEDAQRYRLGANFLQLPSNTCPFTSTIKNYQTDGLFFLYYSDGAPNYYPNSYNGPVPCPSGKISEFQACGTVRRYETYNNDFDQPQAFWLGLSKEEQQNLLDALVLSIRQTAPYIQQRCITYFSYVNKTLSTALENQLRKTNANPPPPTEKI